MGTIAEKLNYLNTTKTNIKNAIIEKGVSVSDNDTFRSYASKIADIEPTLGTKTITANGTYTASDDSLQGYSEVTVDIDDTDLYRDTTDSTYESVKTLSNCGAFPMLSLKVGIEPIQEGSGDPSPTNIRPISGWDEANVTRCGKNLFDAQDIVTKSNHTTYTYIEDGYLYYNAGNSTVNGINWYGLNFPCPLTFSGSVKNFASANENANFYATFDDGTQSPISVAHQLTPNEERTFSVIIGVSGKKLVSLTNSLSSARQLGLNLATTQLELGSTATTFENFNGHTYTIDLDGTRYGGTLDVVSGTLVVDRAMVDLGTLDWVYTSETNRERFGASLSDVKWVSDAIPINAVCSALVVTDFYTVYNHATDNTIGMWHGTTLAVNSSAYTDAATFKTAMNGVQLVYELATPLTYQLTPTQVNSLLGTTNLWADTGDVGDVRYFKKVEL